MGCTGLWFLAHRYIYSVNSIQGSMTNNGFWIGFIAAFSYNFNFNSSRVFLVFTVTWLSFTNLTSASIVHWLSLHSSVQLLNCLFLKSDRIMPFVTLGRTEYRLLPPSSSLLFCAYLLL
jgi:hypothetical protein